MSSFNFLLSREEDENVTERLTDVDLQHRHHHRIDVVCLRSLRVVDVHWVAAAWDPEYWSIIKELNTTIRGAFKKFCNSTIKNIGIVTNNDYFSI